MATIAIALVFQDHYGFRGKFEKRELMIKRIPAASGGWGLPGIEITPGIEKKGIEVSLKQAIGAEMIGMIIPELPKFVGEIGHEGNQVLIYHVKFVGRPERDYANPSESAIFRDWSPYALTDLAKKVIRKLPRPRDRKLNHDNIQVTAF